MTEPPRRACFGALRLAFPQPERRLIRPAGFPPRRIRAESAQHGNFMGGSHDVPVMFR